MRNRLLIALSFIILIIVPLFGYLLRPFLRNFLGISDGGPELINFSLNCGESMSLDGESPAQQIKCGYYGLSTNKAFALYFGKLEQFKKDKKNVFLVINLGEQKEVFFIGKLNYGEIAVREMSGKIFFPASDKIQLSVLKLTQNEVGRVEKYYGKYVLLFVPNISPTLGSKNSKETYRYFFQCLSYAARQQLKVSRSVFDIFNITGLLDVCQVRNVNIYL